MVTVSILILNWNQPKLTIDCVHSVLRQDYQDFDIVLIDNDSKDDSVARFKEEFSGNRKIKLVVNSKNFGYAGGNNKGVKHAKGKYILILNNDTIAEPGWLRAMVEALESDKRLAMVTSNVINCAEPEKFPEFRKRFSTRRWWTTTPLCYSVELEKLKPGADGLVETFAVNGCSFIYRREPVKLPFDDDYFIYAEETKLSWVMRVQGYGVKIAPKARLFHLHSVARKSDKKVNTYFTFLGERNKVLNWYTWFTPWTTMRLLPVFFVSALLLNLFDWKKIPSRIKAYLWVLAHPGWIIRKRREIRKMRNVKDKAVFRSMSCKIYNDYAIENKVLRGILRGLNAASRGYYRLVGLKTMDHLL
jgi:GT2 family glycosyltransferase